MGTSRRVTILAVIVFVLIVLLGVWWYFGFSINFSRFFAAELTPAPTPTARPAQVTCSPASQNTTVGASVTINARGGVGDYTWTAPDGTVSSSGQNPSSIGVTYSVPGTKKVTVQSTRLVNDLSSQFVDSVACTVIVQ